MGTATEVKGIERRSARERLLDAANDLFYNEGTQTVGIDRIIERAGVAKASLYNTFGSKEDLVRAYLESRHARTTERLNTAVEEHTDPVQRILAVFEAQGRTFTEPNFRGCAFISASAEAPTGGLVEKAADDYRDDIRSLFTRLVKDAGVSDPAKLAHQLHLLYDGAGISARMDRDPSAAVAARVAAAALLDSALTSRA
jgi:AcrR family transcriptional regulator